MIGVEATRRWSSWIRWIRDRRQRSTVPRVMSGAADWPFTRESAQGAVEAVRAQFGRMHLDCSARLTVQCTSLRCSFVVDGVCFLTSTHGMEHLMRAPSQDAGAGTMNSLNPSGGEKPLSCLSSFSIVFALHTYTLPPCSSWTRSTPRWVHLKVSGPTSICSLPIVF
jgi:hypothetical protein